MRPTRYVIVRDTDFVSWLASEVVTHLNDVSFGYGLVWGGGGAERKCDAHTLMCSVGSASVCLQDHGSYRCSWLQNCSLCLLF